MVRNFILLRVVKNPLALQAKSRFHRMMTTAHYYDAIKYVQLSHKH